MPAADRRRLGATALLLAASLALFWPGIAMYDTVAQYGQALAGEYEDWHPPAMARLWAALGGGGAAPMLVLQLGLYWLGLGLIAATVPGRAAWAVLAIGAWPVFLGWQGVVLKDGQMTGALLAATGLVAWWRLRRVRVSAVVVAVSAVLVGYAVLVRANAAFAAVPLAVLLVAPPRAGGRGRLARAAAVAVGTAAVLALLPPIDHGLLDASDTGVQRTQAIYDLAGIAVRLPPEAAATGLRPAETAALVRRRCVRPFFWDPLGEPTRCDATVERLRHVPVGVLYATLARAILHHPLAYAGHRLAHLNSTERWLVPWRWPGAQPPMGSQPNDLGLGSPGAAARWWQWLAGWLVETPLGWPVVWVALALAATGEALARPAAPARDLAAALLGSALCLEASFAVLSIASDLRYHLWPMIATALAAALLAGERRPAQATRRVGGGALALVVAAGAIARLAMPLPPQSYVGMLG